jgi:hypothetical protein
MLAALIRRRFQRRLNERSVGLLGSGRWALGAGLWALGSDRLFSFVAFQRFVLCTTPLTELKAPTG